MIDRAQCWHLPPTEDDSSQPQTSCDRVITPTRNARDRVDGRRQAVVGGDRQEEGDDRPAVEDGDHREVYLREDAPEDVPPHPAAVVVST